MMETIKGKTAALETGQQATTATSQAIRELVVAVQQGALVWKVIEAAGAGTLGTLPEGGHGAPGRQAGPGAPGGPDAADAEAQTSNSEAGCCG